MNSVLHSVNCDPELPDFKRTTLFKLLKEIGFTYKQQGNKVMLVERDDISILRYSNLRKMKHFRVENQNIVFLDERMVNVSHSVTKVWRDTTINTSKGAFSAGLTVGLKQLKSRVSFCSVSHRRE